jgi:hypothetical protein
MLQLVTQVTMARTDDRRRMTGGGSRAQALPYLLHSPVVSELTWIHGRKLFRRRIPVYHMR